MARAAKPTTQNLLTYSEQFDNAAWVKRGTLTVTPNQIANPINGAVDADLISGIGLNGGNDLYNSTYSSSLGTAGQPYTPSVWIKRVSTVGTLAIISPNGLGQWNVDLSLIGSDWVRLRPDLPGLTVITPFTLSATGAGGFLLCATAGYPLSVYAWGAQLVRANWAGAYVKVEASPLNTGNIRNLGTNKATIPLTQNLLKYSEQFNQAAGWTPSGGLTVTPNATTAPDGTATADELVCPVADGYIPSAAATLPNRNIGTQYVLSVWLWSAAKASIGLRAYTLPSVLNGGYRTCNLTSTPTRFELTVTLTSGLDSQIVLAIENRAVYGSDALAGNVYAWGAQIVNANWAGPYVKTEAEAVNTGNIRNRPTELQNLVTYSEQFDNGSWALSNTTITANQTTNPVDGLTTADELFETTGSGAHQVYRGVTAGRVGSTVTISVFMKYVSRQYVCLSGNDAVLTDPRATFDIINGTVTYTSAAVGLKANIVSYPNGWFRISISFPRSGTFNYFEIFTNNSSGVQASYVGDASKSVYVFGAQMAETNWLTPYIQTVATAVNNGNIRNTS